LAFLSIALVLRLFAAMGGVRRSRPWTSAWLCVPAVLLCGHTLAAPRVLVVASSESAQYLQALQGVRDVAGATAVESLTLGITSEAGLRAALHKAARETAVVTLGSRAATLVANAAPQATVIGCLVRSSDSPQSPATKQAATRELPADQQVAWLKRLMPQARNVGILYDPGQDTQRVGDLAAALRRAGLTPVLETVDAPAGLPVALERLATSIDALLTLPDVRIYNPQTEKAIVLFSFRHKVPLIGISDYWVKRGALYGLDWDYREFGAYCGQLAMRQLAGARSPVPTPPRSRLIVNLHTAEQFHFHWDDDIRALFDRTYD
jgi:putative ABC transport system substrate-binding protein